MSKKLKVVSAVYPEMSGKILDESHLKFHVTCKAKMINAIIGLKNGISLLDQLSKLKFSTDKRWLQNTCNDPNVRVMLEILEEYKTHEHRPTRAKILIPLIEYAIALYASDLFFRERGEWFLYRLSQRSKEMKFHTCFVDPKCWYPLTRNDYGQGEDGNAFKLENDPNKKPIEQEYIEWYGIDPLQDMTDIPEDQKKKIIAQQLEWVKNNAPADYARFTGDSSALEKEIEKYQ